ncbi:hypothetical protein GCM10009763_23770 [Dermacoccus profundi]|uniref:Uncharacterized protein n=1 Tax=Dermacoccus profundi TaxID=322602 RepID=A0ABN2DE58_9MICO
MSKLRVVTIDDRLPPGTVELPREAFWLAAIAAGHVTVELANLERPLVGPRGYLVADMTDSRALIESRLSDMTLSSGPTSPPYLVQIVEGIGRLSSGNLAELKSRLEGVEQDFFRLDFPVRKSRSILEAKLTWTITSTEGPSFMLSVKHSDGLSLYSLPDDYAEYVLAKGVARSIVADDSCPLFEDSHRNGYFKSAPSYEVAGDYFELPTSFFLTGGSRPR